MNKSLKILAILAIALVFNAATVQAEPDFSRPMPEEMVDGKFPPPPPAGADVKRHRPPSPEEFEKRLNLTDEQKALAKQQRDASIEKIKPILGEIKTKKAQISEIEGKTLMTKRTKDARIAKLRNEIRELRKQAHEIRKENMKAFEATLTEEQQKELQKMKEEGRKRFEEMKKHHHK